MPRFSQLSAAALTALALAAGCQKTNYVDRQKVDNGPLPIDTAMQQRQWEPVTAQYQNGATENWSTGFAYSPNHDANPYTYYLTDTTTFLVNVVTLPYTYYQQRGGQVSGGVQIPPSYTAIPPQEPTTQPIPKFFGR